MNLLKRLITAWKKTRKDVEYISKKIKISDDELSYYDFKSAKNQELMLMLEIPMQYLSRLQGKDYWDIDVMKSYENNCEKFY